MTGWPLPGVAMRVVDTEGRDVRADGEQIGEIIVRGNTVMDGYYRDPDATATTIRDGWLHTGDMAIVDEHGYVLIKDRSKDVIIRGGENISSVEVENAISAHPAVLEVAVVAAPDEKFGEVPVALVVLKPGAAATAKDLQGALPGAPGPLQGAARVPFPRVAPQGRHRQDPQGRAARAVLEGLRGARALTAGGAPLRRVPRGSGEEDGRFSRRPRTDRRSRVRRTPAGGTPGPSSAAGRPARPRVPRPGSPRSPAPGGRRHAGTRARPLPPEPRRRARAARRSRGIASSARSAASVSANAATSSAQTTSHAMTGPSARQARRAASDRAPNVGSLVKTSSRTFVSTAVIIGRRRSGRGRAPRGRHRAGPGRASPDERIDTARKVQDPDQLVEVVRRHQLAADQPPAGLLEVEHGPRPESQSVTQPLRDGDLALLADGRLHTDTV